MTPPQELKKSSEEQRDKTCWQQDRKKCERGSEEERVERPNVASFIAPSLSPSASLSLLAWMTRASFLFYLSVRPLQVNYATFYSMSVSRFILQPARVKDTLCFHMHTHTRSQMWGHSKWTHFSLFLFASSTLASLSVSLWLLFHQLPVSMWLLLSSISSATECCFVTLIELFFPLHFTFCLLWTLSFPFNFSQLIALLPVIRTYRQVDSPPFRFRTEQWSYVFQSSWEGEKLIDLMQSV